MFMNNHIYFTVQCTCIILYNVHVLYCTMYTYCEMYTYCTMLLYCTMLMYCIVQCSSILLLNVFIFCTVHHYTVQCIVLYCTMHCIILYNVHALYCTIYMYNVHVLYCTMFMFRLLRLLYPWYKMRLRLVYLQNVLWLVRRTYYGFMRYSSLYLGNLIIYICDLGIYMLQLQCCLL